VLSDPIEENIEFQEPVGRGDPMDLEIGHRGDVHHAHATGSSIF